MYGRGREGGKRGERRAVKGERQKATERLMWNDGGSRDSGREKERGSKEGKRLDKGILIGDG